MEVRIKMLQNLMLSVAKLDNGKPVSIRNDKSIALIDIIITSMKFMRMTFGLLMDL